MFEVCKARLSGAVLTIGPAPATLPIVISLREATKAWFVISLQTFGGPAGQISVMQRMLVEEKRWLGQRRFLHALNYCMLLPGPEAQQLAIYTGWLLNGIRGGIIAGVLFVLPGMLALLALSAIYVGYGDTEFPRRPLPRTLVGRDRDRRPGGRAGQSPALTHPSLRGAGGCRIRRLGVLRRSVSDRGPRCWGRRLAACEAVAGRLQRPRPPRPTTGRRR